MAKHEKKHGAPSQDRKVIQLKDYREARPIGQELAEAALMSSMAEAFLR